MALIISKETSSGVNASYWKISSININIGNYYIEEELPQKMYNVSVDISGYYNKSTRQENKNVLETLHNVITIPLTIGPELDLRPTIYNYLKTTNSWEGAVDDL